MNFLTNRRIVDMTIGTMLKCQWCGIVFHHHQFSIVHSWYCLQAFPNVRYAIKSYHGHGRSSNMYFLRKKSIWQINVKRGSDRRWTRLSKTCVIDIRIALNWKKKLVLNNNKNMWNPKNFQAIRTWTRDIFLI